MTMAIETVAIMAPGDMGHSVGAVLKANGLRVVTCLEGRSERTRALAARAGIEDLADDTALLSAADVLLSILVPAQAEALAQRIAAAMRAAGSDLLYVDCNAIAPETARRIGSLVEAAGGRFVDAGIIGPPPRPGAAGTRFYASGAAAREFAALRDYGLDVRVIERAAGRRVCGQDVLRGVDQGHDRDHGRALVAALRLGVSEALRRRAGAEPGRHARAHAAERAGHGAEGASLGRRDGGDRQDLRGRRPDAPDLRGRGRALRLRRRDAARADLAGAMGERPPPARGRDRRSGWRSSRE